MIRRLRDNRGAADLLIPAVMTRAFSRMRFAGTPGPRPEASAGTGSAVRQRSQTRTDIQGLRAVAVTVVVVFHLWPTVLAGGYVGVDVFFVVSGFLITGQLLRSPVRGLRDVAEFWARRIRRLVPAATFVLVATMAAGAIWLPSALRGALGKDAVAAALCVQNWRLATSEGDYLSAAPVSSAVQHYWALSVAGKFYVVWPLLLVLVAALATLVVRRTGWDRRTVVTVAVAVAAAVAVVGSLVWSVHLTRTDPVRAYFVSTTRMWELVAGGLLAGVVAVAAAHKRAARPWRHTRLLRAVAAWTGLVLIVAAAYRYDATTPFPGTAALVPVVGTLLVVAAAADNVRGGPGRVLALRPVQWVGDISYSLYLWNWPLIVIVPFAVKRDLGFGDTVAVLGLTLVLAALTKRFVEDGLRWNRLLTRRLVVSYVLAAVCVTCVGVFGGGLAAAAAAERNRAAARVKAAVVQPCVGADAVRHKTCSDPGLLTPPDFAATDRSVLYADRCWNHTPFATRNVCTYGVQDATEATARIAVFGNSHAGHWVPALEDALDGSGWQLTTYLQSVCYTVDRPIQFDGEGASEGCQEINQWAVDQILSSGTDLVIMSNQTFAPLVGVAEADQAQEAQAAYRQTIAQFTKAGIAVLVVRDTPTMGVNVPECVAQHSYDLAACGSDRTSALPADPLVAAAASDRTGLVSVLDLSDMVCDPQTCLPVVGGVIVYVDNNHLTATFVRTLAPEVVVAVEDVLARR